MQNQAKSQQLKPEQPKPAINRDGFLGFEVFEHNSKSARILLPLSLKEEEKNKIITQAEMLIKECTQKKYCTMEEVATPEGLSLPTIFFISGENVHFIKKEGVAFSLHAIELSNDRNAYLRLPNFLKSKEQRQVQNSLAKIVLSIPQALAS